MLTQGGEGLLPLPPRPLVMDRKWKPHVELAPNCPRCDSSNTKFCYYNNYSLTQPRYFCKNCRRYWTKGGSLRNVPVGGGCRKYRRGRVRITSTSTTYGGSSNFLDRSRVPSDASVGNLYPSDSSSMATSGEGDASTIDLALLYAKFLNHQPADQSDHPRLVMPELGSDFNPSIHEQLPMPPPPPNSDPHFQVFIGEFDMNHKQEERINLQFMSLESNCCGLQPLGTEDGVVQDMFWSNSPLPSPPPLPNSNFQWQATHMQRFESVAEDETSFHSNQVNGGNNWSSFDLPEL